MKLVKRIFCCVRFVWLRLLLSNYLTTRYLCAHCSGNCVGGGIGIVITHDSNNSSSSSLPFLSLFFFYSFLTAFSSHLSLHLNFLR